MGLWGTTEELFEAGLELDPSGCGAGWARIAIAARVTDPVDALECAARAVALNPDAWGPWYRAFVAQPPYQSKGRGDAPLAAAYRLILAAKAWSSPSLSAAVATASYEQALAVAKARIAQRASGLPVQASRGRSRARSSRLVGLGFMLIGITILYAMARPGGQWCSYAISGLVAVCGFLFGLPLLVTGRIRQPR
jgi:hypothetical protein